MRHSLKIKLTLIMASLVTAVVVLICVLNTTMFEKFYIKSRQNDLKNAYSRLTDVLSVKNTDSDVVQDTINQINYGYNINVFVLDGRWNIAYSSQTGYEDVVRWIQDINFNPNVQKKILEENSEYTIVQSFDSATSMSYIVATGILSDGSQIIMQITIQSMQENINTYNRFVIFIGTGILLVSIIVVYIIAAGITKPVKKLSEIAEEVSDMNFDAKYEGSDKGEIGVLGNSINVMSAKLERNISELKTANMELMKDNEIKTRNDEMRREFLGNVSHELKTPMTTIGGYIDGMLDGTIPPEETKHYLGIVSQETGRLARLVQNMLDITKLEAGEVPIHAQTYDLWKTVTDVVLSDEQRIEDGKIDIQGLGGDPLLIYADPDFVHQVVYNIVDNAIKFTPAGGTISFAAERHGNMVEVRIENTGAGIAPEALPFVFERFYKEDRSRGMNTRGSGLGLHICKILVNLSGGQIHAESEEGSWCRFVFTLPAGQ